MARTISMYVPIDRRVRQTMRFVLTSFTFCFVQFSHATYSTSIFQNAYSSQVGIDFGNLSPMNIALIVLLGIVAVVVLVWLIRRSIRRRRLSSSRAQRFGTSGSVSDSNLLARSRPEKTEVVRTIVIGSEGDVDVKLTDEGVSSRHAEILVLRQVDSSPLMPLEPIYYVRDMASTRGIEVFREDEWTQFRADVVLDDEQLRIGEVETTPAEINRLALETRRASNDGEMAH
ncbi:MAG: FHA domain-containing protein [Gammaproteobacteria bacterium]|nr:FHA domain-containing protein [Gammaproteobacteria bacterium]